MPLYLSVILLALAWTVPFGQPYHRHPIPSFYAEWSAAVLGLAACIGLVQRSVWKELTLPTVALIPLGLGAVILVQALSGLIPYAGQALLAGMYLVWASLLMVLGAVLRQKLGMQHLASALALALVLGGEYSALVGTVRYYDIHTILVTAVAHQTGSPAFGNLFQPNHYATYEAIALASVAYLFAVGRFRSVIAVVIIAAPLIYALALSASRSAWLYLAALLVLAAVYRIKVQGDESRRLCGVMVAIVIGFGVTQWLPTGIDTTATNRILSDLGVGLKMQHVRTAWWAFTQAPLIGVGWRNFAWYDYQYQAFFGAKYLIGMSAHTHNIITHLLAETGLAGTIIVVGGAIAWLVGVLKRAFHLQYWWIMASLGVLAIHSMLEYPLWYTYFLGIAAILLGIACEHRIWHLQKISVLCVAVLFAGASNLVTLWWNYRDLEQLVPRKIVRLNEQAIASILLRAESDPVLLPYAEFVAASGIPWNTNSIHDRLALNTRVMHFAPAPTVLYREAVLLALSGQRDAATRQLDEVFRVYPDELKKLRSELKQHVASYPSELAPLLELATAKLASTDPQAH